MDRMASRRAGSGIAWLRWMGVAAMEGNLRGKPVLLAALALLAAAAFWPSPAAAQFGFPGGGGMRMPLPIPGMFGPPGNYGGNRAYRHSGTGTGTASRHRQDNDGNSSGEVSKDDLANLKNKPVDKAVVDKAALDKPAIDTANAGAVNSETAPKPGAASASDATRTAEVNAALYEHGPDLTPER